MHSYNNIPCDYKLILAIQLVTLVIPQKKIVYK